MLLLIQWCAVLWVSYGICLMIYRLTLHPLAKFPGPRLTAVTKWWEFYLDVIRGEGGGFMYEMDRMHDVYGPIVRINPDEIHVRDPTWIDTLYPGPGPIRERYGPAAQVAGVPQGMFGTLEHSVHRHRRDAVNPFASKRTARLAQASIQGMTKELCSNLRNFADTGESHDILLPFLAWSTDVAYLYLENKRPGLLRDEEKTRAWAQALRSIVELSTIQKQIPLFTPLVFSLPEWLAKKLSPTLYRFITTHKDMKLSAMRALSTSADDFQEDEKPSDNEAGPVKPDVYQTIVASNLAPQEKEAGRIAQEVFTLVLAGSSSTARVLTRATFHLASNPAIVHRLRQELSTVMAHPSTSLELERLETLPYLTAVIKESLRMTGLVSSRSPLISPDKPLYYDTWTIPAKTPISMTLSTIHADPSIFTDPYDFRPERWLVGGKEQAHLEKFLVPFGRGQRMCIGMNFAWVQLYIGIATLFRTFDFELDSDMDRQRDVDITRDCFLGEPSRKSRGVRVMVKNAVNP